MYKILRRIQINFKYIVLEFCHDTKRSRCCHLFNLDLGLVYSLPMVSYKDYTRLHINLEPWTTCLRIDCRYWSLKPILLMFTIRGTNDYWLITLSCMGWNMIEVSMIKLSKCSTLSIKVGFCLKIVVVNAKKMFGTDKQ